MKRIVPIVVAWAVAIGLPSAAAAFTVVDSGDLSGNGRTDVWVIDVNGDGIGDEMRVDGNENGVAEVIMTLAGNRVASVWMDANLDGVWDTVIEPRYASGGTGAHVENMLYRDADQNGRWENIYFDGNRDNYYEWVAVDANYDGSADSWVGNSAPAGQTATDQLARQVASIEAVNILHGAGLSVFFPTVSTPLGG